MMRKLCAVLKDLDIKLAFDDFGVGQARLVELGEVRPDYLKFDMKLTKNINHAPAKRQEVVALFANLVNNLGFRHSQKASKPANAMRSCCRWVSNLAKATSTVGPRQSANIPTTVQFDRHSLIRLTVS